MNLQDIEETEWPYGYDNVMLWFKFQLGEKFIKHNRRVYDSMNFLEDAGGVVQSMMFIGIALHYLMVSNEEPQQLLKHHFKVNEERFSEETDRLEWLSKSKSWIFKPC